MKYPSLPVAGAALALCRRRLLVTAAVAALAVLASAGVGHAQDRPVVPAAPTVALRSCDTGCLVVDAGSLTYTDGSALALPPDGAYALANGGDAPLLEVQGRRAGETRWMNWNHVADHDVHWGVRRGDVSGHLEARGLRDGASYDVRARVRDPNDPANAVSDWSTVASAAPAAWPAVSALRADVGPVTGAHEHEGRYALHLSWAAPANGPSYSGYYVSAAYVVGDEFDCHNDLNRADPYRVFNNLVDNEFVTETSAEIETEAGALGGPLRVCVSPAVGPDDGRQVALAQARGAVPSVVHNPQVRRRADGGHVLSWMPAELSDGVITASQWRYHTHDLVEVDGHPVENWSEPVTVTGAASEVEFTFPAEPRHGDPYLFSVRSKSGTGWGAWSNSGGHYRFAHNHPPTVESPIDDITLLGVVEPMNANGTHDYRDEQRAVIGLLDVFADYDGQLLQYEVKSSDSDAARVQLNGYTLTVYAADPGEAVVTVTASDGHGGTATDEFTVTVEDPFDPWVYDAGGSGRIDEQGWRQAKTDYAACAAWVTDPDNAAKPDQDVVSRIGCYGELGKPYLNLFLVKRLHEQGHVRVYLSWGDTEAGNDGHAVVDENVGTLQVHVRRHQPAPAGGAVYDLLLAGNTPGASDADVHPFSSQVTIAEGQREGSATLKVVDDRIDETRRYRGVSDHDPEAHETFIVTAVSPDGVQLGRVLLSIRDNDGSVDAPLVPCDRDGAVCNERPQPNGLPDLLLLSEREDRQISLAQAFTDPEGDPLTLTANSSVPSVATVMVTGQTLVVEPQARGNAVITVSARDSADGEASTSFALTVRAAPVVAVPIADVSDLVTGATRQVSIDGVFEDPDGGGLTYEAVSSDEAVVQASLTAQQLTLTATGRGTATVTVTAVDEDENRTDDPFMVTVRNRAPTLTGALGDLVFGVAGSSRQVPLSGLFSDADGDALTYQAKSSDTAYATAAVSGSTLTVTAIAKGTATTTVTAIDGRGGSVAESFGVTVKAAPVVVQPLADISSLQELEARDIDISAVFKDADGDALTYRASSSNDAMLYVAVPRDYPLLTLLGEEPGTAIVTLTATDSDGNAVQDVFSVTVKTKPEPEPDNQLPVVAYYLGDETLINESDAYDVGLWGVFSDPDGDALTLRATSSNGSVVTATVSADYGTLKLAAQSRGTATIRLTATDGRGSEYQTFTVTVKAAPVVASAISDVAELEEGREHDVALSGVFHDADGDDLQHWTDSTDGSVAYAFVDGSTLTVVGESAGSATITVYAEDVDGNRTHASFAVTVVEPADDGSVDVVCPEDYRHVHDGGDHWHSFFADEYSSECFHTVGRMSGNVSYHEH